MLNLILLLHYKNIALELLRKPPIQWRNQDDELSCLKTWADRDRAYPALHVIPPLHLSAFLRFESDFRTLFLSL